ncbi:hypothetical protein DTL42_17200 [Bremerella cremea]|uniref:PBP domain-containing protein n=1 Tax=Bremerella cremea TaxID=1031537 RepID=A0A368KQV0_9BACT|nr:hypothetical protein [Bremerella cremea]RCS44659.1 hypothetical protein DTL42_17200 [Bremerella cremea]
MAVVSKLDESLPGYRPLPEGVSGKYDIMCSRLTESLVLRWASEFQKIYPDAQINLTKVTGDNGFDHVRFGRIRDLSAVCFEGSGPVPKVLGQIGHNIGFTWPVVVGVDQLEIIVHPNNPIDRLGIHEVAWIYSTQSRSIPGITSDQYAAFIDHPQIVHWKEFGTERLPKFETAPINVYQRRSFTDDRAFLQSRTVGDTPGGITVIPGPRMLSPLDDKNINNVNIVASADAMVESVTKDKYGIGFTSHSMLTDEIRSVPIYVDDSDEPWWFRSSGEKDLPYAPELPLLNRPLYLWIKPSSKGNRPTLEAEFVKFILSRQGQAAILKKGFYPLPASFANVQQAVAMRTPSFPFPFQK